MFHVGCGVLIKHFLFVLIVYHFLLPEVQWVVQWYRTGTVKLPIFKQALKMNAVENVPQLKTNSSS